MKIESPIWKMENDFSRPQNQNRNLIWKFEFKKWGMEFECRDFDTGCKSKIVR